MAVAIGIETNQAGIEIVTEDTAAVVGRMTTAAEKGIMIVTAMTTHAANEGISLICNLLICWVGFPTLSASTPYVFQG